MTRWHSTNRKLTRTLFLNVTRRSSSSEGSWWKSKSSGLHPGPRLRHGCCPSAKARLYHRRPRRARRIFGPVRAHARARERIAPSDSELAASEFCSPRQGLGAGKPKNESLAFSESADGVGPAAVRRI